MSISAALFEDKELVRSCIQLTEAGTAAFLKQIAFGSSNLVPNEPRDIPIWAKDNLVLPTSVSERSGALELNPIQAAIARLWQTPGITQVTLLKSTRFGSSLLNTVGVLYFGGHLGLDVIFYERTEGDAQDFHDKKLFPIFENSPALAKLKRPDTKSGIQDAWTDRILTNGASLQLRSASNNGSFRAIKGAFICVDEAGAPEYRDRSKKSEGSKLSLIRRRAQEYSAPVIYLGGTPTRLGDCMISAEYSRSSQMLFFMPCPHCGKSIDWKPDVRRAVRGKFQPNGEGLRYAVDENGIITDAWYECGKCSQPIDETCKIDMMEAGELRPTNIGEPGHAGVFTWAAHSTDMQMTWRHVAAAHLKTLSDPDELPTFTNTILALPYDATPIASMTPMELEARAEEWVTAHGEIADAPANALAAFASIDVQRGDGSKPPRMEMLIHTVGANRMRAVIDYRILSHRELTSPFTGEKELVPVRPFTEDSAELVWEILKKEWLTADGRKLRIKRCFVDNGDQAEDANRFCLLKRSRDLGIIPIRGSTTDRGANRASLLPDDIKTLRKAKGSNRKYLYIGTQSGKDYLARTLQIPPPGPESWVFAKHLDRSFFEGLLAERINEDTRRWERISEKNTGEPWDTMNYSHAAERYELRFNRRLRKMIDTTDPDAVEASLIQRAENQSGDARRRAAKETEADPDGVGEDPSETASPIAVPPTDTAAESAKPRFRVVQRQRRPEPVETGPSERVRRARARKPNGLSW